MGEKAEISTADEFRLFEVSGRWVKIAFESGSLPGPDLRSYPTMAGALRANVPSVAVSKRKGTHHAYAIGASEDDVVEFDVKVFEPLSKDLSSLQKVLSNAAAIVVTAKAIDADRQLR